MTNREILQAIKSGDLGVTQVWNTVKAELIGKCRAICYKKKITEKYDQNSIISDAFIDFYNNIIRGYYDPNQSWEKYFLKIVKNRAFDKMKIDKREQAHFKFVSDKYYERLRESKIFNPDDEKGQKLLHNLIAQLTDRCKEAIVMMLYGWNADDITDETGHEKAKIYKDKHQCINKLAFLAKDNSEFRDYFNH
ncbi:MAG: hypothetical protein AAFO82_25015 [Bacteroidota bacterium]